MTPDLSFNTRERKGEIKKSEDHKWDEQNKKNESKLRKEKGATVPTPVLPTKQANQQNQQTN